MIAIRYRMSNRNIYGHIYSITIFFIFSHRNNWEKKSVPHLPLCFHNQ